MAKSHRRHSRKRMKGGSSEPASAWGWGMGTVGNGWTQFMNSLSLQPGQGAVAANQNTLVPVNRNNITTTTTKPISGGKRRRRSAKRGGNIGAVFSQAAVPGALILMNNALGKRSRRRHRR